MGFITSVRLRNRNDITIGDRTMACERDPAGGLAHREFVISGLILDLEHLGMFFNGKRLSPSPLS